MALLERGQKIGFVATANPVTPELHDSLQYALNFFRQLGLITVLGQHVFDQSISGKRAVDAKIRADDLNNLAENPEIKAIVNLWGGYDSADLLPFLNWESLKNKLLIGASDFTTILNAMHKRMEIVTYLWVNAIWLGLESYRESKTSFKSFFFDDDYSRNLFLLDEPIVLKEGRSEGILIGGNLQTFSKLIETEYASKERNLILVMEDVGVSPLQIRTYIKQLKKSGIFDNCQGLIVGSFAGDERTLDRVFNEEIMSLLGDYRFPILFTPHIGHNVGNEVMPIGGKVLIDTPREKYNLVSFPMDR